MGTPPMGMRVASDQTLPGWGKLRHEWGSLWPRAPARPLRRDTGTSVNKGTGPGHARTHEGTVSGHTRVHEGWCQREAVRGQERPRRQRIVRHRPVTSPAPPPPPSRGNVPIVPTGPCPRGGHTHPCTRTVRASSRSSLHHPPRGGFSSGGSAHGRVLGRELRCPGPGWGARGRPPDAWVSPPPKPPEPPAQLRRAPLHQRRRNAAGPTAGVRGPRPPSHAPSAPRTLGHPPRTGAGWGFWGVGGGCPTQEGGVPTLYTSTRRSGQRLHTWRDAASVRQLHTRVGGRGRACTSCTLARWEMVDVRRLHTRGGASVPRLHARAERDPARVPFARSRGDGKGARGEHVGGTTAPRT